MPAGSSCRADANLLYSESSHGSTINGEMSATSATLMLQGNVGRSWSPHGWCAAGWLWCYHNSGRCLSCSESDLALTCLYLFGRSSDTFHCTCQLSLWPEYCTLRTTGMNTYPDSESLGSKHQCTLSHMRRLHDLPCLQTLNELDHICPLRAYVSYPEHIFS
jgi:hypothetical protein